MTLDTGWKKSLSNPFEAEFLCLFTDQGSFKVAIVKR